MAMGRTVVFCIIIIWMLFHLYFAEPAPELSLVKTLPGFSGTFPSKHYSGYVVFKGNPPKHHFYYFVESENNPARDPVLLWQNGGPGCSSFYGFIYEHGPFKFEATKQGAGSPANLHLNPYSWSKVASIIYLDAPLEAGFSYSSRSSYYISGDIRTAADTHDFLLKWFEQFPEFSSNPFYLAGESYAGIFVPTLASAIDKGIKTGVKPMINLKGYMVGNGLCDKEFDNNYSLQFSHGMGLISDNMFEEAQVHCKGNDQNSNTDCQKIQNKIDSVMNDLNFYNILEPCFKGGSSLRDDVRAHNTSFLPSLIYVSPLCLDYTLATKWLNVDAVRNAIHVTAESPSWTVCSDLRYSRDAGSMINYHKNLTANGYRALIYSGDHDSVVPFTGTQAWTRSLGYKIVGEWRPWMSNGQIAGFIQEYANNFTFLTVKGAGHSAPESKPREALDFFSRWLNGQKV